MKIGMRTTKTAIAVMICMLTRDILNLMGVHSFNIFFAGIGAVNAMQDSIIGTRQAGFNRIFGTAIGAIISLVIYPFNILLFKGKLEVLFAGLGIIIVIKIITALKKPNAVFVGCIVLIASLTKFNVNESIVFYVLNRTIETTYGIIIAIIVNETIKPPKREIEEE